MSHNRRLAGESHRIGKVGFSDSSLVTKQAVGTIVGAALADFPHRTVYLQLSPRLIEVALFLRTRDTIVYLIHDRYGMLLSA